MRATLLFIFCACACVLATLEEDITATVGPPEEDMPADRAEMLLKLKYGATSLFAFFFSLFFFPLPLFVCCYLLGSLLIPNFMVLNILGFNCVLRDVVSVARHQQIGISFGKFLFCL